MSDVLLQDPHQYAGISEHLWPKFAPAFVDLVSQVTEIAPGVTVVMEQSANSLLGFQGTVSFAFRARTQHLVVDVSCRPDVQSSEDLPAFDCRSQVYQFDRDRNDIPNTILGDGPRASIPLKDKEAMGSGLAQWADATVTFIKARTDLILVKVEAMK
jgi:hypothetical protein